MALVKFRIHYVKGKENARADTFSRRPNYTESIKSEEYRIFKMIETTLVYVKPQVNKIKEVNYICNIRCLHNNNENRVILKEVYETRRTIYVGEKEIYDILLI